MGNSMDSLESERKKYGKWQDMLPPSLSDLKDKTAFEALGELKKRGHIKSITVVNAPPRTVSTIISKCLAESPSLDLKGLPVMHEVLEDSGKIVYYPDPKNPYSSEYLDRHELVKRGEGYEHHLGSNILMGKLLESGVADKKGADLMLKIMSHDFSGKDLQALLPHVDNVVSTTRQPAQHIQCVQDKVMHEKAYDYEAVYNAHEDMVVPMRKYWEGFTKNVNDIDKWASEHPQQGMRHVVISGDKFLHDPVGTLKFVCEEINNGRDTPHDSDHPIKPRKRGDAGYMEFSPKMLTTLSKPVYFSYIDTWGQNEIKATKFDATKRKELQEHPRNKLDSELGPLCDELDASFGRILIRHPHTQLHKEDNEMGANAVIADNDKRNLRADTKAHMDAQTRSGLGIDPSENWADLAIKRKLAESEAKRGGGPK